MKNLELVSIMQFGFGKKKLSLPTPSETLPGRTKTMIVPSKHYVNGNLLKPPFPEGIEKVVLGMGCFWGAERKFWELKGVYTTAVGYAGGITPNSTYQEVCTGLTGHNEVVLVIFNPQVISYIEILKVFWENHNPTQGMRQGNDVGTQYRSGIYTYSEKQKQTSQTSLKIYQQALKDKGYGEITTEILDAPEFYYAEEYHQQYLAKNPGGYCGLGGTNVSYPV